MPILVEAAYTTEFATVSKPAYRCDPSSYSHRSSKVKKMPPPQVSPAKRRLNFDDPSKPLFTHPAADRHLSSVTTARSPCVFVDEEMGKVAKESSERWNFDFVKGVPLPGRFQWESVTSQTRCDLAVSQENEVELVFAQRMSIVDDDETMSGTFVVPSPRMAVMMRRSAKQLLITDVFRCRKRRSAALSAMDVLPLAENKATRSKRARLDATVF